MEETNKLPAFAFMTVFPIVCTQSEPEFTANGRQRVMNLGGCKWPFLG